jgi:hypothetical protein
MIALALALYAGLGVGAFVLNWEPGTFVTMAFAAGVVLVGARLVTR